MSLFAICGLVLAVTLFMLLIRQFRPEYAPPISICLTIFVSLAAISTMVPLINYLKELQLEHFGRYLPYLFKSMGIAFLTATAADLCRDCGENAVATKLELLGKCEIVLLSLPLLKELLGIAVSLMQDQ